MGRFAFALFVLLLLAAIAFLFLRPATLTGVNSGELLTSVRDEAGAMDFGGNCRDLRKDRWRCTVFEKSGRRGTIVYRVDSDWLGCWDGERVAGPGPPEISGCVTLLDYV